MPDPRALTTARLRLVPIGPEHADELHRLHRNPGIARWYGGAWTRPQARRRAEAMATAWRSDGVHKWLAYRRADGELIGRGGLSYTEVDGVRRLEVGWAVRERYWARDTRRRSDERAWRWRSVC